MQLSRSLTDAKDIDSRLPGLANPIRQQGIALAQALREMVPGGASPEQHATALRFLADCILVEESELRWLATNITVDAFNFWSKKDATTKLREIMANKTLTNLKKFDEIRAYASGKGGRCVAVQTCATRLEHAGMVFSLNYGMVSYSIRSLRHFIEADTCCESKNQDKKTHMRFTDSLEKRPLNIVGYSVNATWAWMYWFWTALNAEDDTFRVIVFGQFPKLVWSGFTPTMTQAPRLGLLYVVACCILGAVGIEMWGVYELCSSPTPQGKTCVAAAAAGFLQTMSGGLYMNCTDYKKMVPSWGDCLKI